MLTYELDSSDMVFTMDMDTAETCYHQGDCTDDVRRVVGSVDISDLQRQNCRDAISSTGAKDDEEIDAMEDEELVDFVVWMAACTIAEGVAYRVDVKDEDGDTVSFYETYVATY